MKYVAVGIYKNSRWVYEPYPMTKGYPFIWMAWIECVFMNFIEDVIRYFKNTMNCTIQKDD